MKRFRTLGFLLWLALALALGQQAVLAHDIGHLSERLSQQQDSNHAPSKCDEHFTCAQLASAVGASAFVASIVAAEPPRHHALPKRPASIAARFAFRSRAPPALPA